MKKLFWCEAPEMDMKLQLTFFWHEAELIKTEFGFLGVLILCACNFSLDNLYVKLLV